MDQKPWFVLSPCGTSLLTNGAAGKEERDLVINYSNSRSEKSVPLEDRDKLSELVERVRGRISAADETVASELSAELKTVIRLYRSVQKEFSRRDFHQLIATDTWLGSQTASMVKDWLESRGCAVDILMPRDLRTDDSEAFQLSLSEIVTTLAGLLPRYRASHIIIFSLTGGFKSIQGFLQSLAPFYADETVYIFESGKTLLRIPRLPVKLDPQGVAREHAAVFRKLALGIAVPPEEAAAIPETLVNTVGEGHDLSPWGILVWEESRKEIYSTRLLDSPTSRLCFSERFKNDVATLEIRRVIEVNEKVDDLVRTLHCRANFKSVDLKKLKGNPCPPSTHECDAWSDGDARRIYCHRDPEDPGRLVLDGLGKHL